MVSENDKAHDCFFCSQKTTHIENVISSVLFCSILFIGILIESTFLVGRRSCTGALC